MKILITGASGFVGSHLCERLTKAGHQVLSLVRDPSKMGDVACKGPILVGDLTSSSYSAFLNEIPRDLDAVIHTAGLVHSFKPDEFYRVNHQSTVRLFHALKDRRPASKKPFRFIFLSSLAAMGPSKRDKIITEKRIPKPVSEYGRSKLLAENQLLDLELQYPQVELFIVRPPMIIGPRDAAVLDILKMVRDGLVLTSGPGAFEKQYSFISIFDLVEYLAYLTTASLRGPKVYFASHPQVVSLKDIVSETKLILQKEKVRMLTVPPALLKITSKLLEKTHHIAPLSVRLTPDKLHEILAEAWICSGDKLMTDSGIQCRWDLKKTLEETILDYQTRGWL
jgi:nucleoside-diphosphate-sugar epimerase